MPSKNGNSIKKTAGKGGGFFISTDDNLFILKTLTEEELEVVRDSFLARYVTHRRRNPNTLMCDVIGIYTLVLDYDEVSVVLLRNVVGPFKTNVICNYDLKGSIINRIVDLEEDDLNKIVMKDINFELIEKRLFLLPQDKERLIAQVSTDAYFLADLELMDYSLFVVKIELKEAEVLS